MNDISMDQLDRYLDGLMTDTEKRLFESRLETDEALAEELDLLRRARASLHYNRTFGQQDAHLAETLKTLKNSFAEHSSEVKRDLHASNLFRKWRLAIGAILLAVASVIIYNLFFKSTSCDRLFEKYNNYPVASFTTKSAGINELMLEKASNAFNSGDYALAGQLLRGLTSGREATEPKLMLYLGFCLLEQKKPWEAEKIFLRLRKNQSFADEADWYLALSYLSAGQWEKAMIELEKTPATSRHRAEATDLLVAIRNCGG